MSDASLAVQRALRTRLIMTPAVTALVPADHILDRNERPAPSPSIILGEDQIIDPSNNTLMRERLSVISTVHIWNREPGLAGVKEISGAIRRALGYVRRLDLDDPDFVCTDTRVDSVRYLRDPDGETAHAVMTIYCLIHQCWRVTI